MTLQEKGFQLVLKNGANWHTDSAEYENTDQSLAKYLLPIAIFIPNHPAHVSPGVSCKNRQLLLASSQSPHGSRYRSHDLSSQADNDL